MFLPSRSGLPRRAHSTTSIRPNRIWHFPIVYPDGPVDSEALIVSPDLSALYLFEKTVGATARLFKLAGPFQEGLDSSSRVLVALGPLSEPQGEAIAYDSAGTGIWTVSESPSRTPGQPLHHYPCR